jgi:phosphoglucosamine mutase
MGKLFGTDGIRGPADGPHFEDAQLRRIAHGLADFLAQERNGENSPGRVVLGRDPRKSGERIEQVLADTLASRGAEILLAGVVPTPAVAYGVITQKADLGIMLTASHNPATDNGIKLFAPGGGKFPAAVEAEIEAAILETVDSPPKSSAETTNPVRLDLASSYRAYVQSLVPPGLLQGWRIVVDTAHGATTETTPAVLRSLGAEVFTLGDAPDGENINCGVGSEHPESLQKAVREQGAQLGLAHDGDGDRLVLVDETGALVDGDCLLGLLALDQLEQGTLRHGTLVVTIMSNLALDAAVHARGGQVIRAGVGDRQVAEAMVAGDFGLGGEASGHLILRDWLPTGDGLLAALAMFDVLVRQGRPLSDAGRPFALYPQLMRNLPVAEKPALDGIEGWPAGLASIEKSLAGRGRVLVRYSGTEPKVRLLVEAESEALTKTGMDQLEALAHRLLPVTL